MVLFSEILLTSALSPCYQTQLWLSKIYTGSSEDFMLGNTKRTHSLRSKYFSKKKSHGVLTFPFQHFRLVSISSSFLGCNADAYSESHQTSKMELFAKIASSELSNVRFRNSQRCSIKQDCLKRGLPCQIYSTFSVLKIL